MSLCLTIFMSIYLRRENARREAWARENDMQLENYTEEDKTAERERGDYASFFRYTV